MTKLNYRAKAIDSFRTKKNLFVFNHVLHGGEISTENFSAFKIDEDLVHTYTAQYWQYEKKDSLLGINIEDIYHRMKQVHEDPKYSALFETCKEEYIEAFKTNFPKEELLQLFDTGKCAYCDITKKDIEELARIEKLYKKSERGWSFEIDRINSNLEYSKDNCVLSCYWCNNAKTDEFNFIEFKLIGQAIKKVWERRLKR